jgi:hypothetical protein
MVNSFQVTLLQVVELFKQEVEIIIILVAVEKMATIKILKKMKKALII